MHLTPQKIDKARNLLKSTRKGTAWTTRNKILALFALLYLISPIDLLPDWAIPLIGWLDDLGIIGAVALWISTHRRPASQPLQDEEQA